MKVLILQSGAYVQYCEPNFSGYSEIPTNHLILFTTNGAKIKAVKMKYNLSKGCPYCINLKCTKEPLLEFECVKNKELKIKNAGACFVAELDNGKNIIIENCPDFAVRSICSIL